ncbi:MAG: sensor histidine kinase [Brevinema sp.]
MNNYYKKERFFKKALETLPKLQKDELIRLSKMLITERSLIFRLIEMNPKGVVVYQGDTIIFESAHTTQLLKECGSFVLSKTQLGIISLIDIYQKERILDIDYQHIDNLDVFYIADITISQQDLSSQKTRKGLDALETMAAGISHEIKNPLSAIDIHTQFIQRQINKNLLSVSPDIKDYISVVQHESKRLLSILDDFLNMTRKMQPILVFTELSDIIANTGKVFEKECLQKHINFQISISQVPKIFTAPTMVQQALSDLIRNAIEALQNKEKKIIRLTLSEDHMKNHIVIGIEDSGSGISSSIRNRVFEPYFTTKKNGTGLGLTLVNKMIHEVGGGVLMTDSELGGAFCQIFLPISKGQRQLKHL